MSFTHQHEVLAHIGNALLSAQIVEQFVALLLEPSPTSGSDGGSIEIYARKPKEHRLAQLRRALRDVKSYEKGLSQLDVQLRQFQKDRNKLVHKFQELGTWDLRREGDCYDCVSFLRDFIKRAAALNNQFVTALSVRDVKHRTRVSGAQSKRYKADFRRVFGPLEICWADRLVPACRVTGKEST